MTQYDVARILYEADSGLTVDEIGRKLDITGGTIRFNLKHLKKKGYVTKNKKTYKISSDKDESDIENLKPKTLDEIL
jgi:DNA-binding MarR family transcriptional regulator